jgi:hypothetical protein
MFCLLAAGFQLAAQSRGRTKPDFENDQVVVNAPRPWPGTDDPATDLPKACATLPPPHRARCAEPGHNWHNHKLNRVMIYFFTGGEMLTYLDGSTEDLNWQAGTVKWSPASGFHYSGPSPTALFRNPPPNGATGLDIGMKKPGYPGKAGGTALDPLRVAPRDFQLEFENSQVRVLRLNLGPRQSVPMHEYTLNHLIVYFTDQNVRETSPEAKAAVTQHQAFDFSWAGPSTQRVDNLSDKPFEAVVIELKTIY